MRNREQGCHADFAIREEVESLASMLLTHEGWEFELQIMDALE